MKKLFFLFLIMSLGLSANNDKSGTGKAATKVITGKVMDLTGETLPGAEIRIAETGETFYADLEGRFTLNLKTDRSYNITVNTIGYLPANIKSDQLTTFSNLSLKPL